MQIPVAILLPAAFFLAAAQQAPAPTPLQPPDVLGHVKRSISWYRHLNSIEQSPALANDVLLRESTHTSAVKALQLAFDFGHAAASLLDATTSPTTGGTPQNRNLTQAAARAAARVDNLRAQLKAVDDSMQKARGKA